MPDAQGMHVLQKFHRMDDHSPGALQQRFGNHSSNSRPAVSQQAL